MNLVSFQCLPLFPSFNVTNVWTVIVPSCIIMACVKFIGCLCLSRLTDQHCNPQDKHKHKALRLPSVSFIDLSIGLRKQIFSYASTYCMLALVTMRTDIS